MMGRAQKADRLQCCNATSYSGQLNSFYARFNGTSFVEDWTLTNSSHSVSVMELKVIAILSKLLYSTSQMFGDAKPPIKESDRVSHDKTWQTDPYTAEIVFEEFDQRV